MSRACDPTWNEQDMPTRVRAWHPAEADRLPTTDYRLLTTGYGLWLRWRGSFRPAVAAGVTKHRRFCGLRAAHGWPWERCSPERPFLRMPIRRLAVPGGKSRWDKVLRIAYRGLDAGGTRLLGWPDLCALASVRELAFRCSRPSEFSGFAH